MTHEKLQDLAILNSLGALDGGDLQELQTLTQNPDERTLTTLAAWDSVAATLPEALPLRHPANSVKAKLMRRIQELHAHERSMEGPGTSRFDHTSGIHSVFPEHMEWSKHLVPGISFKVLSESKTRGYVTMLMKVEPGTQFPEHHHSGEEECYVISGSIILNGKRLPAGVLHHGDEDSEHGVLSTEEGALLLLVVAKEDYIPPVT
ncbi:MAG: cupin domain-containing protein [Ignavibacteriae bacterium]|nr:cupin domain-containing protein [Ignavibacteriota bacterium]